MPLYVCSLPNPGEPGVPHECIADDPRVIEAFAQREDKPGRSVYDCVSSTKARCTPTQARNHGRSRRAACRHRRQGSSRTWRPSMRGSAGLSLSPTGVRNSGHGRHVRFKLKEPIDARDSVEGGARHRGAQGIDRASQRRHGGGASRRAAAPARYAQFQRRRLARGRRVMLTGARYDLGDIEEWRGDVAGRTLFTRKSNGNGHDKRRLHPSNPANTNRRSTSRRGWRRCGTSAPATAQFI